MKYPVVLCLLTFATMANGDKAKHPEVREKLRAVHDTTSDSDQRLAALSRWFVGKPYALSPLGEGPDGDRDTDPLVRFDKFDCVTYVEEVMALAWYDDLDIATKKLQEIRYKDGVIDYASRNHIMMAQWIPHNIAAGFVRDVTKKVAGKRATTASLMLTRGDFTSDEGKKLMLVDGERPLGLHEVPIIPVDKIARVASRIPHGTIITTIRTERHRVPYRASHVGLVVVRDGKRYVRHAHKPRKSIVEDRIERFIKAAQKPKRWKVTGFNLLEITEKS